MRNAVTQSPASANTTGFSLDSREGLSPAWIAFGFCLALLLIASRELSLFTRPQFWAEDGSFWYAQAYNGGWLHSLTVPQAGYLSTVQRLGAGFALLVPLRLAPLAMAIYGLVLQALPVPILLSARCSRWAPLTARILFAAIYVAIPNAHEIHVVCTNTQWHLALIELLLATAVPPRTIFGRAFDIAIFLLGSVSGPFVILLLPFMAFYWWRRRSRWTLIQIAVSIFGSVMQIAMMLHLQDARHHLYLGATATKFIRILGGDIFISMLRGTFAYGFYKPFVVCLVAAIVGLFLIAYCARFASLEVRMFFVYCFAMLAISLRSPLTPIINFPVWTLLLSTPSLRYWFFPGLAFLFAVLWCAMYARSRIVLWTCRALLLVLCTGIVKDWRIKPLVDLHFSAYAAAFEAAPAGTHVTIPLNPIATTPSDQAWQLDLTKK